ncbi:MAG: ATP-grasp domain-containing protein [Acidimicrobiales bacterium]|nr:ATP-grasp domain-containing protein [Acidimicrobiales bacterium]
MLIDKFLERAAEFDVDALADSETCVVAGIQEHIEEAGIHSGDSSSVLPPFKIAEEHLDTMRHYTRTLARSLKVRGLINIQFAIKDDRVYVLEVNPRASRTVPFVSKVTGQPLAKIAARVMVGRTLDELGVRDATWEARPAHVGVKEAVFPFVKFPGTDTLLGPEMRSTGEVMGIDATFGLAFAKSQAAAGDELPGGGAIFFSLADRDKDAGVAVARRFVQLGFSLAATAGTAAWFERAGVPVETVVAKVGETSIEPGCVAERHDSVDAVALIRDGKVNLVVNTPRGRGPRADGAYIRRAANQHRVACLTTVAAARAAVAGIGDRADRELMVRSLQEYHEAGQERLPLG